MAGARGDALDWALALARAPGERHALRQRPLPEGMDTLLQIAGGAQGAALADAAAHTGVAPAELIEAARFYLREVLFFPEADAYRVLGLAEDAGDEQIKQHHRLLQQWLHPDRPTSDWDAAFAARVNAAWSQLRTADRREAYARTRPAALPVVAAEPSWATPARLHAAPMDREADPARWRRRAPVLALFGVCAVLGVLAVRDMQREPETRLAGTETPAAANAAKADGTDRADTPPLALQLPLPSQAEPAAKPPRSAAAKPRANPVTVAAKPAAKSPVNPVATLAAKPRSEPVRVATATLPPAPKRVATVAPPPAPKRMAIPATKPAPARTVAARAVAARPVAAAPKPAIATAPVRKPAPAVVAAPKPAVATVPVAPKPKPAPKPIAVAAVAAPKPTVAAAAVAPKPKPALKPVAAAAPTSAVAAAAKPVARPVAVPPTSKPRPAVAAAPAAAASVAAVAAPAAVAVPAAAPPVQSPQQVAQAEQTGKRLLAFVAGKGGGMPPIWANYAAQAQASQARAALEGGGRVAVGAPDWRVGASSAAMQASLTPRDGDARRLRVDLVWREQRWLVSALALEHGP